jgi:hypothetical protein
MPRACDLRTGLGMDWGSASPGCVLWGAVLPNGHMTIFDELKFQRMTVKDVAEAIKTRNREWNLKATATVFADPALKADTGQIGESIGQTFARYGVPLIYPSNDRVSGWQRVHEALAVDPATQTPWLTLHPRCKYGARTLPLMVQAKNNPEDMDSDGDDHFCDALRYLLMGGLRPATGRKQTPVAEVFSGAWFRNRFREDRGVLA